MVNGGVLRVEGGIRVLLNRVKSGLPGLGFEFRTGIGCVWQDDPWFIMRAWDPGLLGSNQGSTYSLLTLEKLCNLSPS